MTSAFITPRASRVGTMKHDKYNNKCVCEICNCGIIIASIVRYS